MIYNKSFIINKDLYFDMIYYLGYGDAHDFYFLYASRQFINSWAITHILIYLWLSGRQFDLRFHTIPMTAPIVTRIYEIIIAAWRASPTPI